ncbi:MAG: hypothetical protein QY326_00450 [Bdellovibrionota bacterium]|nr:MAG: hypothetical protein QY326_00450 [Bdellovibrionota bacterium]
MSVSTRVLGSGRHRDTGSRQPDTGALEHLEEDGSRFTDPLLVIALPWHTHLTVTARALEVELHGIAVGAHTARDGDLAGGGVLHAPRQSPLPEHGSSRVHRVDDLADRRLTPFGVKGGLQLDLRRRSLRRGTSAGRGRLLRDRTVVRHDLSNRRARQRDAVWQEQGSRKWYKPLSLTKAQGQWGLRKSSSGLSRTSSATQHLREKSIERDLSRQQDLITGSVEHV